MSHAPTAPARLLRAPTDWAPRTSTFLLAVAALSGVVLVAGLFVVPDRIWHGYLMGFHLLTGMAVAGPFLAAILAISGGRWARNLEPVLHAMGRAIPAAGAAGLLLLAGVPALFEWSHGVHGHDPLLEAKLAYLNFPFMSARLVVFFALWWFGARLLERGMTAHVDDPVQDRRSRMRSGAIFLLLFTPTWSLASIDWMQSLDPHWFSAIYGLLTIASVAMAGLAAAALLGLGADRERGIIHREQLNDISAMLLGLTVFWGYIWYSQYMLIWYTNLPEETPWYTARLADGWGLLTKASLILGCIVPFLVLMPRAARRSRKVVARVAVAVLVARVLDVYVLCGPPLMGETLVLGLWELAGLTAPTALFAWLAIRGYRDAGAEPGQDHHSTRIHTG